MSKVTVVTEVTVVNAQFPLYETLGADAHRRTVYLPAILRRQQVTRKPAGGLRGTKRMVKQPVADW